MKTKTLILSHGAVFAVGAAIAIVAQRPDPERSDDAAQAGRHPSARAGAFAVSGDDSSANAARERREVSGLTDRAGQSATERLAGIVRIADPLKRQAALMELIDRLSPDEFATVIEQYRNLDRYGDSRGEYEMIAIGRGLSPERQKHFFTPSANGGWQIRPQIKSMVEFKELNLLDRYMLGKFDIIMCRNVLIYFSAELKKDILTRLHGALNPGGYLILGASESLNGLPNLYEMVQCHPGIIYRKK